MWIFEQLKKQKEQNENLALKRQLLEKYKTWEISKHEYECALMDMQLSQEEKEFNKNRLTPWKIATKAASSLVKATVNWLLWGLSPFGSSDKTKR